MSDWNNLSDRLKRLGVHLGIPQPVKSNVSKPQPLEEVVSGRNLQTIFGEIFSVNHTYPENQQHGFLPLKPLTDYFWLARWAKRLPCRTLNRWFFLTPKQPVSQEGLAPCLS